MRSLSVTAAVLTAMLVGLAAKPAHAGKHRRDVVVVAPTSVVVPAPVVVESVAPVRTVVVREVPTTYAVPSAYVVRPSRAVFVDDPIYVSAVPTTVVRTAPSRVLVPTTVVRPFRRARPETIYLTPSAGLGGTYPAFIMLGD